MQEVVTVAAVDVANAAGAGADKCKVTDDTQTELADCREAKGRSDGTTPMTAVGRRYIDQPLYRRWGTSPVKGARHMPPRALCGKAPASRTVDLGSIPFSFGRGGGGGVGECPGHVMPVS